jgi:hypothetical protein
MTAAEGGKGKGGKDKDGKESGKRKGPPKGTSPTARRQQKRREEKLRLVREQVAEGSLTIRKMTPEERAKYPPRDKGKKDKDQK